MPVKYTREQFWKLYEKLPQELKDVLFDEKTSDNIYDVCEKNKVLENHDQIVDYVGQVLIGVLPLTDFQNVLEQELKLKKDVAKKVSQEINRFVFYPVKASLEELYNIEINPPAKPTKITPPPEEKPAPPPSKEDTYREQVE